MLVGFIVFVALLFVWTMVALGVINATDWSHFRTTFGDSTAKTIEREQRHYRKKNWLSGDDDGT